MSLQHEKAQLLKTSLITQNPTSSLNSRIRLSVPLGIIEPLSTLVPPTVTLLSSVTVTGTNFTASHLAILALPNSSGPVAIVTLSVPYSPLKLYVPIESQLSYACISVEFAITDAEAGAEPLNTYAPVWYCSSGADTVREVQHNPWNSTEEVRMNKLEFLAGEFKADRAEVTTTAATTPI